MIEEKTLGDRLKKFRGKRTQEEVSKDLGLSRARYSHYENNRVEPDMEILNRMADFFGTTTDFLLGRTNDPQASNQLKIDMDTYKLTYAPQSEVDEKLLWMKYKSEENFELSFEEFKLLQQLSDDSKSKNNNDLKNYIISVSLRLSKRQSELENKKKYREWTEKELEEYEALQEFFDENTQIDIFEIIKECEELRKYNEEFEEKNHLNSVTVAGQKVFLTPDELITLGEIKRKYPIQFHDFTSNPEQTIKELIRLEKAKKLFADEEEENNGNGYGEIED